ncbi:hypothetical protein B0T25DRAFT_540321 [Lasiosphaeria hispida]|uniref:Glucose-methanol-choline oxidoreductase N-terminal domain-containing protein n=1 Tax=Lasiosphaeria hispida TaxID=260671 RepID=A0AAJ0MGU1_9PEZI|nr:hypothetical protein B0T25DRAFT_540321 [Lasiosphaeria hispida]
MRGSGLGSIYDWNFTTTAQPHPGNRTIDVKRGKVLGGSAALNYLATGYLPLAGANLQVRTGTRVAKVEFSAGSMPLRATGVLLDNRTKIAARREVILSAGSIQSSGLLELSGIGQASLLKVAGINTLKELAGVGENYQDHIRMSNVYRLKKNFSSFDPMIYESGGAYASEQMRLWLEGEASWYDYTSSAYSFFNWGHVGNSSEAALLQLARSDNQHNSVVDGKKLDFLMDPSVPQLEIIMEGSFVGATTAYPGNGSFATLITSVMHPMSRGSVHINAADPKGAPVVDPRYLSHGYPFLCFGHNNRFYYGKYALCYLQSSLCGGQLSEAG